MQRIIKPLMEVPARRRRHDTESKTTGNHIKSDTDNPLKRIKRQELNNPQVQEEIIHQRVYGNVLAIVANGYEVSANITIEPVDVIPGNILLIKVAEEGPDKPTVCQLRDVGAFPEFQLRAYSLQPCDDDYDYYDDYDYEGFGPTMGPTELPVQEGNVTTCQQRYNDWLVARRAVPDGNQCVGDDFITQHYSTCFVPPEVIIGPSEAEVIVGETVTITCDATGFPSDYNYQWTVDGIVVPNQRGAVFRYEGVSGVHKIKCKVTSSGGEMASQDSTVTLLPEGTVLCRDVQSLFTPMQGLCVREQVTFGTRVTVDWNQFPMYHSSLREAGEGTLNARATYDNLDGQSFSSTATGQVTSETSGPVELFFPRQFVVQQGQNVNITLHLQLSDSDSRPVMNRNCSSCVGLKLWTYQGNCDFSLEFRESNGRCLRAFQAWWTKLAERGGAGSCQDYYLDQPFLDKYRKCYVRPTLQYITSPVKALYRQPARLACIASGGPPPSVRWLRNNQPVNISDRNTIMFDSVTPADTGNYTCVIEEREFFNQTLTATASLELQGLACTKLQQTENRLLGECASDAGFGYLESESESCWPSFIVQQNTSIYQLQLQLFVEGQSLPWIRSNEATGAVNLNITILWLGKQTLRPLRRRDVRSRIVDSQSSADRFKRAEPEPPVSLHQKVYRNVLVLRGEPPTLNVTIEPVNTTLNDIIQVDITEEGSNTTLCQIGIYPEIQLMGYIFSPCNRNIIPNDFSESLRGQEESLPVCQQRYSEWLVARKAVPDGDSCVGPDLVTSQYQKCFIPPEVSIRPSEIQDLVIGETVTITCDATGFPSDYNYQWTVDGTVVPNQRGAVFRYDAVSGVHKVKCKVTSSGGETESEDSTMTVLPEGTMTFVSSIRITARSFTPEMTDPTSTAFQNISSEIKDWYQQAMGSVQGQVSIRVKDAKPGSVIATQNINVQDSVLQDKDLYNGISNALRTAAQSPSSLGVDPNSVTLLSASTCYGETVTVTDSSSNRVTLTFPSSAGDTHAYSTQRCANNTESAGIPWAVRRCIGSFETGVSWASPELLDCGLDLSKLAQMPVTEGNVAEVAADLQILTSIGGSLTIGNIRDASTVLGNIANTTGDENVGYSVVVSVDQIMNIEDDILYQSQVMDQAPSRIVQALEQFNDRVNLTSNRFRRIEQNIGVETYQIGAAELINSVGFASLEGSEDLEDGLVRSYSDSSFIPNDQVDASIALPGELGSVVAFLKENIPDPTDVEVRLSFIIYQSSRLFQSNQTAPSSADTKTRVNSRVIASRVTGFDLKNLPNPVVTRYLPIVENSTNSTVNNIRCVSWDFNAGGGGGAWSTEGCNFVGIDNNRVVCECNHLTNFAVLMDIYGGLHSFALDLISKIGIALSITGLVLTLITYLVFKQLRQTRPQHLLINLCLALLATLIIFLAGINATSSPVGCTVVAFLLHYFLLAVFMWMAIEAFNMYLAFVKVLGAHVSKFLLKAAILAWGLPFVIAIITLVVDVPSNYPDGQETYRSTSFCWLQGNQLYFGFLLPAGLVLLFNTIVYIMVISKLTCRGRTKGRVADPGKGATKQQLRIAIAVMVLVGLTWIFGFFMISDGRIVFSYLFCIFNSLQGFFIFIFQCVRQKEVQNLWFKCCGCPADMYRTTKSSGGKSSSNQTESTAEGYSRGHRKSSAPETVPNAYTNIPMNSI
ncbi:ADGRG4 [Branchiostoma lanceolatum]|nr:ADGRG4 [Branchiostoma lanceolatum]